jgi:hypothetical protein
MTVFNTDVLNLTGVLFDFGYDQNMCLLMSEDAYWLQHPICEVTSQGHRTSAGLYLHASEIFFESKVTYEVMIKNWNVWQATTFMKPAV